jgi:hypothetical protein
MEEIAILVAGSLCFFVLIAGMEAVCMLQQRYYVCLWQEISDRVPVVQVYAQAPSEGHAVVQVMKKQGLSFVARAHVARSAQDLPLVRLVEVFVRGKIRRWRQEPDFWKKRFFV